MYTTVVLTGVDGGFVAAAEVGEFVGGGGAGGGAGVPVEGQLRLLLPFLQIRHDHIGDTALPRVLLQLLLRLLQLLRPRVRLIIRPVLPLVLQIARGQPPLQFWKQGGIQ